MTTATLPPSTYTDRTLPVAVAEPSPERQRKPQDPPVPQHPIPFMQDAFAESLVEATKKPGSVSKPKLRTGDAKTRRDELLDQEKADPPPAALWRYRPGQVNHELRRLMAQISFGVYLLLNGMANSQVRVVSILQGHIDEVDEFLETTLEDIGLATDDLKDRTEHLRLPMENMPVFEGMLENYNYRMSILEGNMQIEHIIARTQIALQQTVQDLAEGVSATREFSLYLAEQENGPWRRDRPDVIDIFVAMKGNTDGWFNAFIDLQAKASNLNGLIVRLNGMVAEMDRKASEASRRNQFSVIGPYGSPKSSPGHSREGSDASTITASLASPLPKISSSPPRLSLRLSTINPIQPSSSFFDIQLPRGSVLLSPLPAKMVSTEVVEEVKEVKDVKELEEEPPVQSPTVEIHNVEGDIVPQSPPPPARNPRRLSERPTPRETPVEEKSVEETDTLYILQPRTYTPQPPSPLPSPRVKDPIPPSSGQAEATESSDPRVEGVRVAVRISTQFGEPPLSPRFQQQLRTQPSKPKLVAIAARPESRSIRRAESKPEIRPEVKPEPTRAPPEPPKPRPVPKPEPKKRTSLRDRVSQKTTPPESIQVPPPNGLAMHKPNFYQSPRACPAPDSAYGSDMERTAVNSIVSIVSINSSLAEFPTPPPRPTLVPSPHSDQQFFRPVQASPHSPLQQRPHTSGTVSSRLPPQHVPPRDIPSAMGMSMLSNVTTMTNDSTNSRGLKKKRSAFGWLKKAFSLDEEERAAFEAKKKEQMRNPYFDERSPKYLDGKRIQPRQTQTFHQGY
ncbi:hypothetical protein QBC47DRAFT_296790 [Echria macrotheca]|uniref:Uncharacterized protein n=1 Tax=Echria macrotheca TaxID=438768 RepID=A0AAJ0BFL7_9PEZI|nr:hypothetical protein QBC47DRAFT_296790 [Echria macrotheca]